MEIRGSDSESERRSEICQLRKKLKWFSDSFLIEKNGSHRIEGFFKFGYCAKFCKKYICSIERL